MAELDKLIEGILLQRLVHIIKVWCAEFDRTDDGDARRDTLIQDIQQTECSQYLQPKHA